MKYIELIKLIIALILLFIAIFMGSVFLLENIGFLNELFDMRKVSWIFRRGETNEVFTFLGLCAISGAYLLTNVKSK